MRFLLVCCFPFFVFGSIPGDLKVGLRALQQIRTLIPERLSEEEFSILVEQSAFQESQEQLATDCLQEPGIPSAKTCGGSRFYFSHWTISGEPIRILDSYQEFEYGPYWLYPTAMERLWELESPTIQKNRLVMNEAVLGNITFKGNRVFSPDQIKRFIRAKPGEPVDGTRFVQDMARMNQNPFRRTDAIWRPGSKPGVADLELATIDRMPYRFYTGADNTGTVATERDRFFFGFNFGKTIVEDSELSYQFTCSPNWNRFIAQTALFRVPFPARQTLIIYGGYSQVKPELGDDNHEKSLSWQIDGRYRFPIITNTCFLQEIILGYDFKEVSGRIKRNGVQLFHGLADINQFMIGYELGHKSEHHRVTFVTELYGNPGGMTPHNKTSQYQPFRAGARSQYAYGKISHSFAYQFHKWWFSYDLNGQAASNNLLPSEQFTLAGWNAVRGFEERIVNVDNALLLNLSVQTPRFSIGKAAGWTKKAFDELYFLAFFDYGLGGNHQLLPHESSTVSLASIGPGIRYQIDRYVSARFDYGIQLFHHGFENPTHSRYNFGLIVSF